MRNLLQQLNFNHIILIIVLIGEFVTFNLRGDIPPQLHDITIAIIGFVLGTSVPHNTIKKLNGAL